MITHLCFHGIGECVREREPGEARYWVATDAFLGMLDEIVGRPGVEISFDDGNRSDIEVALPALQERGLDATFFALAGRLEDPMSLGSAELRTLREAGMRVGTHGWHHVPWRGLSVVGVDREVVDARRALEEASGGRVTTAALPLGRYDRTILGQLRNQRYERVYTSDRFPARPSAWLQARYSITARDTPESVWTLVSRRNFGPRECRNVAASVVKRLR